MEMTAKKYYLTALRQRWPWYLAGTITLFLTNLTEVLMPKMVQWCLDLVGSGRGTLEHLPDWLQAAANGDKFRALHILVAMTSMVMLLGFVGRFGWRQLLARRTHDAGRELKAGFWDVLRHQPIDTLHRYPLGDLMNRATADWNAARMIHGFTLVMTFDLLFFTVLALASMLMISVKLTLISLAIFPLLPPLVLYLARREHDQHLVAQQQQGEMTQRIAQALAGSRLARATATDGSWEQDLSRQARDYADKRFVVVKTAWKIFPLGALPTLIAYFVLLVFGLAEIRSGALTIGAFVALQSYVLMLQGPLFDLGDVIAEWQRGFASLGRVVEIFNLRRHSAPLLARRPVFGFAPKGQALLKVQRLSFCYGGPGTIKALQGVSMQVQAGETVGIVGPIGAGKSTLLKAFAGLIEVAPGQLALDGVDQCELAPAWFAANVAMVPQKAFLFSGSIRQNLELDRSYGDAELWRHLAMVAMDAEVRAFPGGLDAVVGEQGINVSGGQKQRLALARALLRKRRLLLLDDCLSAVDAEKEESILMALKGQLEGARAVVWVAHRLPSLRHCDRVYTMDHGILQVAVHSPRNAGGDLAAPLHQALGSDKLVVDFAARGET